MLARICGLSSCNDSSRIARVALAREAGGILLAEVVAHALARVALAVDHPHDQGDQARHQPAERDRGEEPEPLAVVVHVDLLGLAANLFQLFGRLVHVDPAAML